jgi:hypothetical protein
VELVDYVIERSNLLGERADRGSIARVLLLQRRTRRPQMLDFRHGAELGAQSHEDGENGGEQNRARNRAKANRRAMKPPRRTVSECQEVGTSGHSVLQEPDGPLANVEGVSHEWSEPSYGRTILARGAPATDLCGVSALRPIRDGSKT